MTETTIAAGLQTCHWVKDNGEPCRNKNLVVGTRFCHAHYWQALWQALQLGEVPRPAKPKWRSLGQFFLTLSAFFAFGYFAGFVTVGDWIQQVKYMISTRSDFWPPDLLRQTLRQFFAGCIVTAGVVFTFVTNPWWPIKPRHRRAIFLLTALTVCLGILGLVSVITAFYPWQDTRGLSSDLVLILIFTLIISPLIVVDYILIAISVFRPHVATTARFFRIYRVVASITFALPTVAVIVMWVTAEKSLSLALLALGAGIATFSSGFGLVQRASKFGYEWWLRYVAYITDVFQPLPPGYWGDADAAPKDRQRALELALEVYTRLNPLEQKELEEYLVAKHTPPRWQRLMGLLWLVAGALLIEAPMSYLWSWFCGQARWGPPLCP